MNRRQFLILPYHITREDTTSYGDQLLRTYITKMDNIIELEDDLDIDDID